MQKPNIGLEFARNLAGFRKRKGLSQYELADLTGISRRMIGHYESEGIIPPAERLQALAESLNIPVYTLFKEAEELYTASAEANLSDIDPRSVKKFRDILSLPTEDRNDLYRILNKMLRKNQLEKQRLDALHPARAGEE
ncbi:MAG: helix-turn-helix transcriptional regulator [Spirochaetota bacterium]|jgi:transcriptional regulator with XRE-family HTH domain|nr:helix-turn-helix transcriptional regulator [Spirochaetota bacterium]